MTTLFTSEMKEIILSMMEGLQCPRALTVAILLRSGAIGEIMSLDLNVNDYCTAEDYLRAAQATKFLSKLEITVPGLNPEQKAIDTWWEAEKQCFRTNRRLNHLFDFGSNEPTDERLREFFSRARKKISRLIGVAPPEFVDGVFGPGVTVTDKGERTTVPHKLSLTPSYTPEAWPYLVPWTGTKWATSVCALPPQERIPTSVRGNIYFQVPKNAKTNRSCAKEPSLNAFYQRGYGEVMARRLAHHGIRMKPDLYDTVVYAERHGCEAQEVHKRLARQASLDQSYSTIDLSSASDTVCTALVRAVLPSAWYDVLSQLRSSHTRINGHWVRLEKFSSMGNGFTFELETTIFLGLILALSDELIAGENVFVFGDDIIVPSKWSTAVCKMLQYCGFSLNVEKTFTQGPFRESCGGDFWMGKSVRPYHLKELPHEPQDYIAMANGIRRMANQNTDARHLFSDLRRCWFRCLDPLPSSVRLCRGPSGLGDIVIHDEEKYWSTRTRANGIRYVRVYRPVGRPNVAFARFGPEVQLAAALYGVSFIEKGVTPSRQRAYPIGYDERHVPMRGDVTGHKVGWVPYS